MQRSALRVLALALVVAGLALAAARFGLAVSEAAASTAAPPPASETPAADIAMDLTFGQPVIEIRIEGRGPFKIIMDTGAGPSLILEKDLATELGLVSEGKQRLGDPLNPHAIEADVHVVRSVEIAGLRIENVNTLSWDRKLFTAPDAPRGVAGLGLFGKKLVTLDFPRKRLRVAPGALPEPDGRSVLKADWSDHLPAVDIEVGGRSFKAHLDTGSGGFIGLPESAKASLTFSEEPREVGRAQTANSSFVMKEGKLQGTARIGGIVLDNPPIGLMGLPGANVGSAFLKSTVLTFDRSNERVRLTADGPIAVPARGARFGLVPAPSTGPGPMIVDHVDAGTDAEACGLRAGDVIVKANGKPIAEMGPGDIGTLFRSPAFTLLVQRDGKEIEIPVKRSNAPPS